ncbi:MAG: hypothetical protein WC244_04600 [Patescibacteria group bacterium]|jgi:hypothetical protein
MITFSLIIVLIVTIFIAVMMFSIVVGLIMTGVPFVSSHFGDVNEILAVMELVPGQVICDLGCGKAQILIKACKKYKVKGIGYELSLWPYLWARLNVWLSGADVKIYFANFFQADLSKADMIYCYLFPEIMAKLEHKFQKELKPGAKVVSYGFKMPNMTPDKVVITHADNVELGKIYIYKF